MSSPLLSKYCLPPETARGCCFAENFPDVSSVGLNSGVLYNNPPCSMVDGVSLTAVSLQYCSYADRGYSFTSGAADAPFSVSAWVYMVDATNFYIASKGAVGAPL